MRSATLFLCSVGVLDDGLFVLDFLESTLIWLAIFSDRSAGILSEQWKGTRWAEEGALGGQIEEWVLDGQRNGD